MSTQNQEPNTLTTTGFAALANNDALNDMQDELTGLSMTFDRIKIPAGGGTAYEVPGEGEEPDIAKEIVGVILHQHPAYAMYRDKYAGGSNPPDCGSFDGQTGVGDPGGACANCPYNQFGSGEGSAKLCKNKRQLYILQENELFPVTLSLPTGSLKGFTRYLKNQLSKGRKLNQVVTRITLKKATSTAGITYSQAVFSFDRVLTPEERAAVEPLVEQVKTYASNLKVSSMRDDEPAYTVDEETGEIIRPLK